MHLVPHGQTEPEVGTKSDHVQSSEGAAADSAAGSRSEEKKAAAVVGICRRTFCHRHASVCSIGDSSVLVERGPTPQCEGVLASAIAFARGQGSVFRVRPRVLSCWLRPRCRHLVGRVGGEIVQLQSPTVDFSWLERYSAASIGRTTRRRAGLAVSGGIWARSRVYHDCPHRSLHAVFVVCACPRLCLVI